ncbi:exonuclease SbcCD subunit D [Glutamicibacter sp.]|uniref:exonuclease SbcCD subunit D n=1 Tax=Glutamicibacter sp. TaxID=1931995 RepID=UPI0028BDB1E2|nr:exonuclease SbcCD subunit D [Glutamicibacter sp.]
MRLLHTSDWHLGRTFHGASLLDAQRTVLSEIIEITRERQIDAVLISGDIYDRALPHVDAVKLCNWALRELAATGAKIVMTSGNHDSASRLSFGAELLDAAGLHIYADLDRMIAPVILEAADHRVAIYGIPYLEPRMVMDQLGVEKATHESVVKAAIARIDKDLEERRSSGTEVVSVSMAHLFAAGGVGSDSERELSTGNLDVVPVELFEHFDYTALGHLHGRQKVREHVRYSGSPLAYSFSEAKQIKGVWIINTTVEGLGEIEEVQLSEPKHLVILRGELEALLADPELEYAVDAWCQITLTDKERPADAMNRLRERFPDTVVLNFDPQGVDAKDQPSSYAQRLAKASSTEELVDDFVEHVRERAADEAEKELVRSVILSTREAKVSQ